MLLRCCIMEKFKTNVSFKREKKMMMEDTEKKKTVWTHQEQPIYNSKTEERIVKYVEGKASCNNWMSIQLIEKVFYK